ncbi:MAG: hypothetical protein LBP92_00025 [Deltaproteobacteria bacterium]|nr:hypothetical protein [Deltaproteobacteria bacterium]
MVSRAPLSNSRQSPDTAHGRHEGKDCRLQMAETAMAPGGPGARVVTVVIMEETAIGQPGRKPRP